MDLKEIEFTDWDSSDVLDCVKFFCSNDKLNQTEHFINLISVIDIFPKLQCKDCRAILKLGKLKSSDEGYY